MSREEFLERSRTRVRTSLGELDLPVLYRDASAAFAFFRVEPARVEAILADTPFVALRFAGGTALAALAAYEYRDTSIGPYREVGVAVAVVPEGAGASALQPLHLFREPAHRDVGWYVLDLPVTTPEADVGGRELYGFPKFVTDIDVAVTGDAVRAVVRAPVGEEPILTLEGRTGPGLPLGPMDLVLYTVLRGEVLRTVVEARGWMHTGLGRGLTLRVGGADHPMARRLTALGLDGRHPLAAQVCPHYRAVLHAAEPLAARARAA